MKVTLLLISLLISVVASQNCDTANGWHEYDGYCLRVSRSAPETQFTWGEARESCMSEGGDLASIHSQAEQDFIVSLATDIGLNGNYLWIGMSQMDEKTGPFSWSDGTETTYTDWSPSEPRTAGITNCAFTLTEESATGAFIRHDYASTTFGILHPDSGQLPSEADGVNTFFFGAGTQFNRDWCEYMCGLNASCAAYSWHLYDSNPYWSYVCVGRSDRDNILIYDDSVYSGVRSLGSPNGWWLTGNCGLNHAFACKKAIGSDEPKTIAPTVPIESYCPDEYFSADGHTGNKCYKIVAVASEVQGLRWEQALFYCRNQPGINPDLASIHSIEENAIITAHIQDYTLGFWIGEHYAEDHNRWVWADNTEPVYSNWAPGRPSGAGQCGELWAVTGPPGTWSDLACETGRGFICQTYKDADNIIPTPPPTEPTKCPEGWFPYWYSCYQRDTVLRTWADARTHCESLGPNSTLVSIHAEAENSAVFLGAGIEDNYPVWLGLHKENPEDDIYQWTDGWPTYYANFDDGGTSGGGCVVMKNNAKWNDTTCTNTYASICKTTDVGKPEQPPPGEGSCPSGNWMQYGGHCYYFSVDTDTYINAITRCQYLGGSTSTSLVSIENDGENNFIYTRLSAQPNYIYSAWIGLRFDASSSEFVWLDGTPNDYKNWAPGQPNSPFNEPCGEMDVNYYYGMWNDVSCGSYDYNHFVCEAELGPEVTYPPVPTSAPGECPSVDWVKNFDDCFLVKPTQELHWHAALDVCKTLTGARGSLATVRNQQENQYIYLLADALTPDYEDTSVWLGLSKQGIGYPYIWEDSSTVNYTNWAPGEPNDVDGTQNCVRMYSSHPDPMFTAKWDDYFCSAYSGHGYVCRTQQGNYEHLDQTAIEKEVKKIIKDAKRLHEQNPDVPELRRHHAKEKHKQRGSMEDPRKSPPFDPALWKNIKHKNNAKHSQINEHDKGLDDMDDDVIELDNGYGKNPPIVPDLKLFNMDLQPPRDNNKHVSDDGNVNGTVVGVMAALAGTLFIAIMVTALVVYQRKRKNNANTSQVTSVELDSLPPVKVNHI